MKPGLGWKHVGGAVFDNSDGTRVHVMGLCRLPNGELVNGMLWPESRKLDQSVRINGGNRKRGAMAWARAAALRSLIIAIALCVASAAQAQNIYQPGYSGGVGPWQASRVGPWFNYYNASAPVYPIARPYYGGYGYRTFLQEEQLIETRRIRQELEYGRRWNR
jgi:hypothetical protein